MIADAFPIRVRIEAIGLGFLDRTLPKPAWTHAGHFAVTLWLLDRRPVLDLPRDMPTLIRAYNEATDVTNTETAGYHETITLASIGAARSFLKSGPNRPLHEVYNALLESAFGDRDWLLAYWSREKLFSVEARLHWREPDLRPLLF